MSTHALGGEPLVSVVMPAYNAGRYVAEAIESVRAQSYERWELIVVDDGSRDNTAEVVEGFALKDARIKCLRRQNGGQGAARNTALAQAWGPLVAFLDADDLWIPGKLSLQVSTLIETEAQVVFSDGFYFTDDDTTDESLPFETMKGKFAGEEMFKLLFAYNRIHVLSVLVRRDALDAVGLFEESRLCQNCEDYDLWIKLARDGAVFYGMHEHLVRYRRHAGSMTASQVKALTPMIATLKKYASDIRLSPVLVRRRLRQLYRSLLPALIDEGKLSQARECAEELYALDQFGIISLLQRLVVRTAPHNFNFVSRQLYRVEWRLLKLAGGTKE